MAESYYGSVAEVLLYDIAGATGDVVYPIPFSAPKNPFLTGVSLSLALGAIPTVSVSLEAPYVDGLRLIDHPTMLAIGNVLLVRIGYPGSGDFTEWYPMILNQGGMGLTLGPEGLSGSISGSPVALGAFATSNPDSTDWQYLDAVLYLCGQMGMSAYLTEDAKAVLTELPQAESPISFGTRNHFKALSALMDQLGLVMNVGVQDRHTVCRICSIEGMTGSAPDVVMRVRGPIDTAGRVYPCSTWAPESSVFLWAHGPSTGGARGVRTWSVADDLTLVSGSHSPEEMQAPIGAKVLGAPSLGSKFVRLDRGDVQVDVGGDNPKALPFVMASEPKPSFLGLRESLSEMIATGGGLKGTASCPVGIPWILPGDTMRLEAAGVRFDGVYWLEAVTQTWGAQGFTTSLTGINNGTPASALDATEPAGGKNSSELALGGGGPKYVEVK